MITERYFGRRCGRGPMSTRHHDRIFRKCAPNPKLCWALVKNGKVLARAQAADGLLALSGMVGGDVQKEAA